MNALLNAAWDAACDNPSDKLVLVYLADRANVNGKAWPHLPTIARQTHLCKRTIIRAIDRLESRKHLTVQRKQGCSSRYILHPIKEPSSGDTKSPVTPSHQRGDTKSPVLVTPSHQHPNPNGTSKGTSSPAPGGLREGREGREYWQLLRDEEALTKRIKAEADKSNPDKELIASLKISRSKTRDEMKSGNPLK